MGVVVGWLLVECVGRVESVCTINRDGMMMMMLGLIFWWKGRGCYGEKKIN